MLTNSNNLNDLQDNDLRYLFRNDDADLRIIRDAGDRGANFGVKCLAEAAGNGRLDIVKYLVEEKHVLDFTKRYDVCSGRDEDENGTKPLVKAAQSGYVQIVQYLLDFNPKLAIIRDDD